MSTRIDVICFPSEDRAFAQRVRGTVASNRDLSIVEMGGLLRRVYPKIALRERADFADFHVEGQVTWYAFRDGRVVP
jgi:hypothetical protein